MKPSGIVYVQAHMNIKNDLEKIHSLYLSNRRSGYTTEISKLEGFIVCPNEDSARRLGDKGVSLGSLKNGSQGLYLLDNHTILDVCNRTINKLELDARVVDGLSMKNVKLIQKIVQLEAKLAEKMTWWRFIKFKLGL